VLFLIITEILIGSEVASSNLDVEISGWNFEKVRVATENRWNKHLSSISVETENEADKKIFYGALYRSLSYQESIAMSVGHILLFL